MNASAGNGYRGCVLLRRLVQGLKADDPAISVGWVLAVDAVSDKESDSDSWSQSPKVPCYAMVPGPYILKDTGVD